jgi:hypothetical protein
MVTPQTTLIMETQSNTSIFSNIEKDTISPRTHTLKHRWNLWARLPQDMDWTLKSYKLIYNFKTIEDSIAITESIPDPLIKSCMLFVMKDGIIPMWEDPKNRNGGCFSYKVSNKNVCDVWRELNYVLVGETIGNNSSFVKCVTGITISPKKNFCIIKIWMTNCDHINPTVVTSHVKGLISQGCLFKKHVDNTDFIR